MVPNYQSVNWVIRNAPILRCGDICNPLLSNLHEKLYREDDPIPSNVYIYIYVCIYVYIYVQITNYFQFVKIL